MHEPARVGVVAEEEVLIVGVAQGGDEATRLFDLVDDAGKVGVGKATGSPRTVMPVLGVQG